MDIIAIIGIIAAILGIIAALHQIGGSLLKLLRRYLKPQNLTQLSEGSEDIKPPLDKTLPDQSKKVVILPRRPDIFVNRNEEIERIKDGLSSFHVAQLRGLGGIGAVVISTDDFALGSREYRTKYIEVEGGNPLEKYDLDLLREKIDRIRNLQAGELEYVPVYDEASGIAMKDRL